MFITKGDKIGDYITLYNYIFNDHKESKEYKSTEKFEKEFGWNFQRISFFINKYYNSFSYGSFLKKYNFFKEAKKNMHLFNESQQEIIEKFIQENYEVNSEDQN